MRPPPVSIEKAPETQFKYPGLKENRSERREEAVPGEPLAHGTGHPAGAVSQLETDALPGDDVDPGDPDLRLLRWARRPREEPSGLAGLPWLGIRPEFLGPVGRYPEYDDDPVARWHAIERKEPGRISLLLPDPDGFRRRTPASARARGTGGAPPRPPGFGRAGRP